MILIYLGNVLKKDIIIKMFNVIYYLWACSLAWLEHPTDMNFLISLIKKCRDREVESSNLSGPSTFFSFLTLGKQLKYIGVINIAMGYYESK